MTWIRDLKKRIKYYDETSVKPPSLFLEQALRYANGTTAIDLGCGSGSDTKEMARQGFKVIAVDINKEVANYFSKKDRDRIKLVIQPVEDFKFVRCDFIYAKSSLVFLSPKKFRKVAMEIKKSLKPGGVFAARLWGKKDSDNKSGKNYKYTFLGIEELKAIFDGYDFLAVNEHEEDKACADGRDKHWHFLDVIIKKTQEV